MPFGGFFVPPTTAPASTPPSSTPPSPPRPPTPKPVVVKDPPRTSKWEEWIDVRIVEDIIKDNNLLELKWLRSVLESDLKLKNYTDRYIKKDRFLVQVNSAIDCYVPPPPYPDQGPSPADEVI